MITASEFRKGLTVAYDGGVWLVTDFQHVKPGKGAAFVRTTIKNVMTGAVVERSFNPTDKMARAIIEGKSMQYLYNDGELYYFMDTETFEQEPLNKDQVEDSIPYIKENTVVQVRYFKGKAFSVEPPNFVELQVVETEPGFKGDTASNTTKPAKLETGYTLKVPLFINQGEMIRIDTRSGEYMERA
jgi:elongation factor P